ncbi:MAG TPA: PSD1 and planctomycete cytochrome C domain-containing protein, partial [Pirellula sp.]|nr:PSD1 and planctomycete cytochrome C domain-containing protein [Pirellula sp.]
IVAFIVSTERSVAAADAIVLPDRVEFNRDIRPILSDRCFACHGPDKNKREAETRLDTLEGLLGNGDKTGPLVPGNPEASELIRRIESPDKDERMPPLDFGKDVSDYEKALLRRWIQQGAKWEGHWAFQPIRLVPSPKSVEDRFSRNPIDGYIFAALRQTGLEPSPKADARTLVRRLCFDLTGLPPKPEWVERFAKDPSDEAYERLVDDLIESPQYGERMAVWWLDLVRYADSVGYHGDQPVPVTPFRDYVIDAFNSNKPFDKFTIEQLAGDLFPDPTTEHQIASGYNRLGMMSAEGGAQPKEYLSKYISERVRNVSGAWLGVTFGCCECHDHKFDPFTTKEFYQLEAFFADIQEQGLYKAGDKTDPWGPEMLVPNPDQKQIMNELSVKIEGVRKLLDTSTQALAISQAKWEKEQIPWRTLKASTVKSINGATLVAQEDASVLASGKNPNNDTYEITFDDVPELTAIRIEVLPHDSLPKKGPGRASNGNFVLSEIEAYWQTSSDNDKSAKEEIPLSELVPLQNATATYEQVGAADGNPYGKWSAAAAIDRDSKGPTWGWGIMEQVGRTNYAVFELDPTAAKSMGRRLKLVLKQNLDIPKHTIGRFRIAMTNVARPVTATTGIPPEVEGVLQVQQSERTDAQRDAVAKHYRTIAPELHAEREKLQQLTKDLESLEKKVPRTLITKRVEPRQIRVLPRGNWMDESGEIVEPGIPAILGKPTENSRRLTRMDLAKWIVSPDNPLTSRAAVNRLWKLFFGFGISRKLDDLGAQGDWPTHLELLDMLAADFKDSGFDMKRIVKLLVMSETYKQ